jgi:CheY-like chemotaxis protein
MTMATLQNCAILVVEDEYLLADDLCTELADHGATVLGPAATVDQGLRLLADAERVHGAVLDVNLRGEPVFRLADALTQRDLPFVFTTGYDADVLPPRFAHAPRCEKPVRLADVVAALGRVTQA